MTNDTIERCESDNCNYILFFLEVTQSLQKAQILSFSHCLVVMLKEGVKSWWKGYKKFMKFFDAHFVTCLVPAYSMDYINLTKLRPHYS